MLPQMSQVFVRQYHWIEEQDITDIFAVATTLPGVVAVNASVLVGYRIAGLSGALVAAFASTLPSFLVLIFVTIGYEAFITNTYVAGAMMGIRAAVTGTLLAAVVRIGKAPLENLWGWALFVPALALAIFTDINVIYLLLGAALLSWVRYWWQTRKVT